MPSHLIVGRSCATATYWSGKPSKAIGVAVRIRLREVMIVHLDGLAHLAPEIAMRTCLELGHALGNQHWPALIKGDHVYVPLTVDRKVMASVMNTHRFEDIRYEFVPGSEVVPYLAPHELRRLFGGAEGPVHSHVHETYAEIEAETGHVHSRSPTRHSYSRPCWRPRSFPWIAGGPPFRR